MNVSGIVVRTAPENLEYVIGGLKSSGLCEVFFHDVQGKIIAAIEGDGIQDEIRKMKEIMGIPGVLCVDLAYSYSGKETEESLERLLKAEGPVPDALRDME